MSGRAEDVEREYMVEKARFIDGIDLDVPSFLRRPKWTPVPVRWKDLPKFVRDRARDKRLPYIE